MQDSNSLILVLGKIVKFSQLLSRAMEREMLRQKQASVPLPTKLTPANNNNIIRKVFIY